MSVLFQAYFPLTIEVANATKGEPLMLATAAKNDQQKGIQIKEKESQRNITAKVQRPSTNFTRVVNLFPDRDLERIEHVFITDSPGFESSPFFLTNDYQILFVRSKL